jgi:hypothetical protein
MKSILSVVLFVPVIALAQVRVHVIDPRMKIPQGKVIVEKKQLSSLPSRESRERFFLQFPESQKQISNWDELQRDFFFDDLRRLPASELTTKYPDFSPILLKKMSGERKK